jgi:hypothetical protein
MSKNPSARGKGALRGARQGGARGAAQQGATQRNILHQPQSSRSKPSLTDRQRVAARMLAMGKRVGEVATELAMHRGTLLRWRERPAFEQELMRLHEQFARSTGASSAPALRIRRAAADSRPISQRIAQYSVVPKDGVLAKMLAEIERQREENRLRRQQLSTSSGEL